MKRVEKQDDIKNNLQEDGFLYKKINPKMVIRYDNLSKTQFF